MNRTNESFDVESHVHEPKVSWAIVRSPCMKDVCVISLEGAFRAPLTGELRHSVHTILRGGARTVVLDLARVSTIDAAGVGQLVRAYNATIAANGRLKIVRATTWVREVLEGVGLYALLSAGQAPTRSH